MSVNKDGASKRPGKRPPFEQSLGVFKRRQMSYGVDWRDVDTVELKAAIGVCVASKVAIQFSQAQGGRGVVITLWDGKGTEKEYALDAVELNELLAQVISTYESTSEDIRAALAEEQKPTGA